MAVTHLEPGYRELERLEDEWRALPNEEQPYLVVFFGLLSYKVLAVCDTERDADIMLGYWQDRAKAGNCAVKSYTRDASPHDFQVRQQWDLDALTHAILSSY